MSNLTLRSGNPRSSNIRRRMIITNKGKKYSFLEQKRRLNQLREHISKNRSPLAQNAENQNYTKELLKCLLAQETKVS